MAALSDNQGTHACAYLLEEPAVVLDEEGTDAALAVLQLGRRVLQGVEHAQLYTFQQTECAQLNTRSWTHSNKRTQSNLLS